MSKLSEQVPFIVECKWSNNGYWEVIAAFNVDSVAKWYAQECQKNNPSLEYRTRMVLDNLN